MKKSALYAIVIFSVLTHNVQAYINPRGDTEQVVNTVLETATKHGRTIDQVVEMGIQALDACIVVAKRAYNPMFKWSQVNSKYWEYYHKYKEKGGKWTEWRGFHYANSPKLSNKFSGCVINSKVAKSTRKLCAKKYVEWAEDELKEWKKLKAKISATLHGSDIFIANNTPFTLKLAPVFAGSNWKGLQEGKHYRIFSREIGPWQRAKVLKLDRYPPVRAFKTADFNFKITVTPYLNGRPAGSPYVLKQNLHLGMLPLFRASVRLTSPSVGHRTTPWKLGDRNIEVDTSFFQNLTGGKSGLQSVFDDVEYAFMPAYYTQAKNKWDDNPKKLRILTYNVYMRPGVVFVLDGQKKRAKIIPPMITGMFKDFQPDVIVFNEVFEPTAKPILIEAMKKQGYSYHTDVLGAQYNTTGSVLGAAFKSLLGGVKTLPLVGNGGVMIFSHWPMDMTKVKEIKYHDCTKEDCLAAKGAQYAPITKGQGANKMTYHIFGTHTNAGSSDTRKKQFKQLRAFVDDQKIPTTEPIIMAGDFNENFGYPVTKHKFRGRWDPRSGYKEMLNILDVLRLPAKGKQLVTHGHLKNTMNFDPGSVNWQIPGSILDHILFKKSHLQPKTNEMFYRPTAKGMVSYLRAKQNASPSYCEILVPKLATPWVSGEVVPPHLLISGAIHKLLEKEEGSATFNFNFKKRWEPSDHFPLFGYLDFTGSKPPVVVPVTPPAPVKPVVPSK